MNTRAVAARDVPIRDTGFRLGDFVSSSAESVVSLHSQPTRFCSGCGSPRAGSNTATVETCAHCKAVHYRNPKIVVRCIAEHAGRVLLCQRAEEPRRGYSCTPGGFVESGETLDEAVARETLEEAGVTIAGARLACVHELPQIQEVVMIFRASVASAKHEAGNESLRVRWFPRSMVPWHELAFPSDLIALEHCLRADDAIERTVQMAEIFWGDDGRILVRSR